MKVDAIQNKILCCQKRMPINVVIFDSYFFKTQYFIDIGFFCSVYQEMYKKWAQEFGIECLMLLVIHICGYANLYIFNFHIFIFIMRKSSSYWWYASSFFLHIDSLSPYSGRFIFQTWTRSDRLITNFVEVSKYKRVSSSITN